VLFDEARHQKPGQPGPTRTRSGEAAMRRAGDEAEWERRESRRSGQALLEAALQRENLVKAWRRVKANGGSAGVDGRSIAETGGDLKQCWPQLREALMSGTYRPQPVRRVTIAKPGGGTRELGIPTVTDRLIQQALLQVLQPRIDPTFSEHSYGFRPGRNAHQAVRRAQAYVQSGKRYVVDVDLEKFFDRVQHNVLRSRLEQRIDDPAVLTLIRHYLRAGVRVHGVVMERYEGTPQGGPLSPLLANVLPDEVDRELERRGHAFVRYADDCNVYVGSRQAGERVLTALRQLFGNLKLRINEAKSAVARVTGRQFLGRSFYVAAGGRGQTAGGAQSAALLQRPHSPTDPPQRRPQHRASGGTTARVCAGMEGVLPTGADPQGLPRTGRMAAPPTARLAPETLEARNDDLPDAAADGREPGRCSDRGGERATLVEQQPLPAQPRLADRVLRSAGRA
jgi:RNA-directed DNA polymerase